MQGKRNPGTDQDSVMSFLQLVRESREINIDRWVCFLKPLLSFSMKSSYGIWMLTNTGNHIIIQLAYCHENGKPKRFALRSNCTSRLASFFACISPHAKDRSTRYGNNAWHYPFFPLMQAYLPHLVTVCFLFGQLLFTPFFLWKNMIYHLQCISIAMLIC